MRACAVHDRSHASENKWAWGSLREVAIWVRGDGDDGTGGYRSAANAADCTLSRICLVDRANIEHSLNLQELCIHSLSTIIAQFVKSRHVLRCGRAKPQADACDDLSYGGQPWNKHCSKTKLEALLHVIVDSSESILCEDTWAFWCLWSNVTVIAAASRVLAVRHFSDRIPIKTGIERCGILRPRPRRVPSC